MAGDATGMLQILFVWNESPLHIMFSLARMALLTGKGRTGIVQVHLVVKTAVASQAGEATFSAMAGQAVGGSRCADIGSDSGEIEGIDRCAQDPLIGAGGIMTDKAIDIRCRARIMTTTEKGRTDVTRHAAGWIGSYTDSKGG